MVPGLGCRHVGMGADLIGRDRAADRLIVEAGTRLGVDVPSLCLTGNSRKPLPTKLEAQLIYTISCAYGAALEARGQTPACVIGHSLGTYAALSLAGALEFATGLDLVTRAEDLMESLIPADSQGLGVVIALPLEKLQHLLAPYPELWLANANCPGQYVVGGLRKDVEAFLEVALTAGAYKAKLLPGARAMHTPLPSEVQKELAAYVGRLPLKPPRFPVVSVVDGEWLRTAEAIREYLSTFLVRPVFWERAVRRLLAVGYRRFVEVGPAAVLTDMMPYIAPSRSHLHPEEEGREKEVQARTASEELAEAKEHPDAPVARSALVRE